VEFGLGGASLGPKQSKFKAKEIGSNGGAGAWLGHVQHILAATKCTSIPIEHTWFVKHVQGQGTACTTKTGHKETLT
jgi:hypothetical protein